MRISRFVVLAALAAVCVLSLLTTSAHADAVWETVLLKTTAGVTTKTFATVQDTAFYPLPEDWQYDFLPWASAAVYTPARITFVNGAAAGTANADTIRYQIISMGKDGTRSYVSLVEQTAAVGNIALSHGTGKVFVGIVLNGSGTSVLANATPWITGSNAILKVAGDPNGAFTNLKVYLTYPRRSASR